MGGPMAMNVLKGGHSLTVHDIRREAAAPFLEAGAKWAGTPAEAARGQDAVITCLPMPRDVDAVMLGEHGVASGIAGPTVAIDSSTNSVETVKKLHVEFARRGIQFLDAPVSGGVRGAMTRDLCVMASGDEATFNRVRSVFDAMGDKVMYCGPVGNGTVCKLAHNMFAFVLGQVTAETLTMGVKAGVPLRTLVEAISKSAAGKNPPLTRFQNEPVTRDFEPDALTFTLALARKDMRLATELARQVDVPMPIANVAEQNMIECMNRGWGRKKAEVTRLLQEERSNADLSKA
jgi:3-hydroxyisobutyrate dehydrogenase